MVISSPDNPLLKKIRKALAAGRLTDDGLAVAEGPHLVDEALRSCRSRVRRVLASETWRGDFAAAWPGDEIDRVAAKVFREISATEHSQGVLALVEAPVWTVANLREGRPAATSPKLVVALDSIQDPGNAGTIIRSAEAFGATGVVMLKGCVHPWNPKVLRATAGSLFRFPVVYGQPGLEELAGWQWLAAAGESGTPIDLVDFARDSVLWIGNEGAGVAESWKKRSSMVRIPTEVVESLNAGVAASVILYEAYRRHTRSISYSSVIDIHI